MQNQDTALSHSDDKPVRVAPVASDHTQHTPSKSPLRVLRHRIEPLHAFKDQLADIKFHKFGLSDGVTAHITQRILILTTVI
ncbi:hypothetical protein BKH37_01650 [Actinomyces naeslundii]|nr:hypothetical protein BKH37_01650 [Actinomyces naeslundii]